METGPHQYAIGTHTKGFARILAQSLNLEDTVIKIQRSQEFKKVLGLNKAILLLSMRRA